MKFPTINTRDIVAILILVGLFCCKLRGMDGFIDASLALVIGYYFSKRVYEERTEVKGGKRK